MKETLGMDPLAGRPRTMLLRDKKDLPWFRIICRELTPRRAKLARQLDDPLNFAVVCLCGLSWLRLSSPTPTQTAVIAVSGFLLAFAARMAVRAALTKRTEIQMTTRHIRLRGWFGWKDYERMTEHRFAMGLHDGAASEAREQQHEAALAAQKGKVLKNEPIYADSCHVVLIYAGHRVDILDVYGDTAAAAIVSRLTYCDRYLNAAILATGGIRRGVEGDWNERDPGGIDHE